MIKPRRLRSGDTIGIIAPSSPFDLELYEAGRALLQELGFRIRPAEGLFRREGYLCGPDQQRLEQFNQMFAADDVHAVLCARGGYGALRILDAMDFKRLGDHPKALIGFSDVTALHQALYQRCGWVCFHGPMLTTLALADDETVEAWQAALTGRMKLRFVSDGGHPVLSGTAVGIVQGGNLATLCHLVGTPFHPQFESAILMLEETKEAPYRIDRMLTQMKMAGCFHGLAGVVLGDFSDCGAGSDISDLMRRCFKDLDIPIAAGFAFGHGPRNLTFPLGLPARLDADAGELVYAEPATVGDDD